MSQIWYTLFIFSSKFSLLCYDYASSATLDEFLRNSRITLNLDVVLAVAIDLIYAIHYMEQKGVVHNNITTANVLIGRGQRVIFIHCNKLRTFVFKKFIIFFEVYVQTSFEYLLFWLIDCSQWASLSIISHYFTNDASTSASTNTGNTDDPCENEIRRKHKHKQNHPNPSNCLGAR